MMQGTMKFNTITLIDILLKTFIRQDSSAVENAPTHRTNILNL